MNRMVGASTRRNYRPLTSCFVLALLVPAGCGVGGSATVEGKVTIDGQPASSGRVFFRSADGKSTVVATIGPDGAYRAVDVPCDTMKVTVTLPTKWERIGLLRDAKKAKKSGASEGPKAPRGVGASEPGVKISEKYQNPDTSGLTLAVTSGTNTYDIEISSKD
jgi:hypothetical protein